MAIRPTMPVNSLVADAGEDAEQRPRSRAMPSHRLDDADRPRTAAATGRAPARTAASETAQGGRVVGRREPLAEHRLQAHPGQDRGHPDQALLQQQQAEQAHQHGEHDLAVRDVVLPSSIHSPTPASRYDGGAAGHHQRQPEHQPDVAPDDQEARRRGSPRWSAVAAGSARSGRRPAPGGRRDRAAHPAGQDPARRGTRRALQTGAGSPGRTPATVCQRREFILVRAASRNHPGVGRPHKMTRQGRDGRERARDRAKGSRVSEAAKSAAGAGQGARGRRRRRPGRDVVDRAAQRGLRADLVRSRRQGAGRLPRLPTRPGAAGPDAARP